MADGADREGPTKAPWSACTGGPCRGHVKAEGQEPIFAPTVAKTWHVSETIPERQRESNARLIVSSCNAVQAAAERIGMDPIALARAMEQSPERLAAAFVMPASANRDAFGSPVVEKSNKDTTNATDTATE